MRIRWRLLPPDVVLTGNCVQGPVRASITPGQSSSLSAGTYYYAVTAVPKTGQGNEGLPQGVVVPITIEESQAVTVSWAPIQNGTTITLVANDGINPWLYTLQGAYVVPGGGSSNSLRGKRERVRGTFLPAFHRVSGRSSGTSRRSRATGPRMPARTTIRATQSSDDRGAEPHLGIDRDPALVVRRGLASI